MKKLLWTLFYIFLFAFLVHNSFSYLDPDFGWHLRFGELIWQSKSVPHDQIFMWTLAGKTWVDHEWLSNLLTFGLWSAGGYAAVSIFFALIPLAAFYLINRHMLRHGALSGAAIITIGALEISALFCMRGHLGVRMQEFTLLGLVLLLTAIDQCRRSDRWHSCVWIVPLIYLWACLHGGFLIALAILAGWLAYEWILYFFPAAGRRLNSSALQKAALWRCSLIALLAALSTLLTPYGLELYHFLGGYRDNYFMSQLQEWLPPYVYPFNYQQIAFSVVAAALTAAIAPLRRKNTAFNFVLACFFIILSFQAMRHFPLMAAAFFICVVPHIFREFDLRLTEKQTAIYYWLIVSCLAALSFLLLSAAHFTNSPYKDYCDRYPCGGISYLQKHPAYAAGPLLNHYNFGGYIIGAWPALPLFIDGRLPQYPLGNSSALREYNLFNNRTQTEEKLKEYGIKTVFYKKPAPLPTFNWFEYHILGYRPGRLTSDGTELIEYLKRNPRWQLVYEDSLSIIFILSDQK